MAADGFENGAIIPSEQATAIEFGSIRSGSETVKAAATPDSFDSIEPMGDEWKLLGNDRAKNCVAVAWANQRRIVTAKLGKKENYPNLDQVYEFYRTQNPSFDSNGGAKSNGPGSGADRGMNMQMALERLVKSGGPDGVRAIAFARVKPDKPADVRAALATFGCLWVGCRDYKECHVDFRKKVPYQGSSNKTFLGGHAIIAGGYVPEYKFVTWGSTARFSDDFWKGNGGIFSPNIYDMFVVIWPEYIGTRNFMKGVDLPLLAKEYKRITGSTIKLPSIPYNSLYYIKTQNTGTGKVEVHRAANDAAYALPDVQTGTLFELLDATNGTFCIESGDLYYIKTSDAGTKKIEIHRASEDSGYTKLDIQQGTAFDLSDGANGSWTIDNGDLWYIKTRNVGSGSVEAHYSDHVSKFAKVDGHFVTAFSPSDAGNGVWTIREGDLYFVKTKNVGSGFVEVHRASRESNFTDVAHYATAITAPEGPNGTWQVGNKGDLYFIKTSNPQSNRIEVHIATASSGYQEILHYATVFDATDGPNGVWCV